MGCGVQRVLRVEVVTDIHCYGVGAICGDFGDIGVAAVLYYLGNFPDVFL